MSLVAEVSLGLWLLIKSIKTIDAETGLRLEERSADARAAEARP